ncbi:Cystathionine gamma-synthase [Paramarasmius palmivorus]|uniref:cystathionine gamma-synthase n=1 Tax=Paramarasmius palmivorus TaxID=297713 RepID=A0AAW0CV31_9AGAR
MTVALGSPVPPNTPHAISVSLPTWRDNVGYEEGDKRVLDKMMCGYPRFFIHPSIQKVRDLLPHNERSNSWFLQLASVCEQKFGTQGEKCMLFPTKKIAEECRSFIRNRSSTAHLVQFLICPEDKDKSSYSDALLNLHIVLFPAEAFPIAKQFWQHAGSGISSRLAEHCLGLLPDASPPTTPPSTATTTPIPYKKASNRHYSVKEPAKGLPSPVPGPKPDALTNDHTTYLEERYGRNLPIASAETAKRALRRRIAGTLVTEDVEELTQGRVSENDVYLFPSGMNAIWSAHQLALGVKPEAKSVCFGFPYTDTLKILQKWGPGCHFFGHGLDSDIDQLETLLEEEARSKPSTPPILALFTEFPSNPLLRSADLPRLRKLADKHDFLIVIDETIGNFMNVKVLPYADVVVSSLTKVFSGASNVMGGSMVLNPQSRHYANLKAKMDATYEANAYFDQDAIFLERNSRDFARRSQVINANTEAICSFLHNHKSSSPNTPIKDVFYPKYTTTEHYQHCQLPGGGYGGLFSVTFTSNAASQAFFDALPVYKGPSLGTNFTLACPFTILAHYTELDWAREYGVEEGLVRISVGMEDTNGLLGGFEVALKAAEAATRH